MRPAQYSTAGDTNRRPLTPLNFPRLLPSSNRRQTVIHLSNQPQPDLRKAVQTAAWQRAEIERFQASWKPLNGGSIPMPGFTWSELERQLCDLAPQQSRTASTLVSAIRKQAAFKPSEMVLREVLIAASVLMDDGLQSQLSQAWDEGCETEEGEMI
jgi:hypothetical protein